MAVCATCGNDYDKAFTVNWSGRSDTFDSIECAAAKLAPQCAHCGCRILGHGTEVGETMYCCAHCARESGHSDVADRQPQAASSK
jgi:DNA-directed RNA polymerase subunit RPC12/RpoP